MSCSGGGRIPDQPVPLTDYLRGVSYPGPTVLAMCNEPWSQPPLGEGLGPEVTSSRARILELREAGHTWGSIAARLNAEGWPTPSGSGHWHRSTVEHHANPEAWAAEQARRRRRG